ncbi:MAG: heterodisulfide reductase-related iron-sulfur binding cluster [Candidatus Thorarchaeota archaeon]|jgi:heterodisulfide reductase subunit B
MKYTVAWGCLVPQRRSLLGYEAATRKIFDTLEVETVDLPNETCCAPFWMQSLDLTTSIALAARNLAKVEAVNHTLEKYPEMKERVDEILRKLGLRYRGTVEAHHLVDFLYSEIGVDTIRSKVESNLEGIEIGLRYGCHMLKPHELLNIEYSERPTFADEILESIGLSSKQYTGRHRCCGGLLRGAENDLLLRLD